jgi:hypothetical protein
MKTSLVEIGRDECAICRKDGTYMRLMDYGLSIRMHQGCGAVKEADSHVLRNARNAEKSSPTDLLEQKVTIAHSIREKLNQDARNICRQGKIC